MDRADTKEMEFKHYPKPFANVISGTDVFHFSHTVLKIIYEISQYILKENKGSIYFSYFLNDFSIKLEYYYIFIFNLNNLLMLFYLSYIYFFTY